MDQAEQRHLLDMRKIHVRRLQTLERQAALFGAQVDPNVPIQIDDLKAKIDEIDSQLPASLPVKGPSQNGNNRAGNAHTIADDVPLLRYLGPLLQVMFQLGDFFASLVGKKEDQLQLTQSSVSDLPELDQALYKIAHDIVLNMNLVGSRIESTDYDQITLRSRAYFIDPQYLSIGVELSDQERIDECERQVKSIEKTLSHVVGKNISMKGPDAKTNLNDAQAKDHMGIRAFNSPANIIIDKELFTAFMPRLSEKARPAMRNLQHRLGIKEVAAVSLTAQTNTPKQKFLGALLVAADHHLTEGDLIELHKYAARASQAIFSEHIIASIQTAYSETNLSTTVGAHQNLQTNITEMISQHWQNYHNLEIQKAKYEEAPEELNKAIELEKSLIEQLKNQFRHTTS